MNIVRPSAIEGTIAAPASKSAMQRYVAIASLTEGTSVISARSYCDDCLASLNAASELGAEVTEHDGSVSIRGKARPMSSVIHCGESGTSLRILAAVAASFEKEVTITGNGTLMTRPMEMIEDPLGALGASCRTSEGRLPIKIKGPIKGGAVTLDGSITSQFLSGLLITLPVVEGDSVITVSGLKSRPYVEMTLDAVRAFGGSISRDGDVFSIEGGQRYVPGVFSVEGDWSSASFLLVAGALAGRVSVTGLSLSSKQADRAVLDALRSCGAEITADDNGVSVTGKNLSAFQFDATECPDLFPPLAALAAACDGTTELRGARRLIHKESNRAVALQKELEKLGAVIDVRDDSLLVTGAKLRGSAVVDPHGDHRIAMALAVAALRADTPVSIMNPSCVQKSYPDFFQDLDSLRRNR